MANISQNDLKGTSQSTSFNQTSIIRSQTNPDGIAWAEKQPKKLMSPREAKSCKNQAALLIEQNNVANQNEHERLWKEREAEFQNVVSQFNLELAGKQLEIEQLKKEKEQLQKTAEEQSKDLLSRIKRNGATIQAQVLQIDRLKVTEQELDEKNKRLENESQHITSENTKLEADNKELNKERDKLIINNIKLIESLDKSTENANKQRVELGDEIKVMKEKLDGCQKELDDVKKEKEELITRSAKLMELNTKLDAQAKSSQKSLEMERKTMHDKALVARSIVRKIRHNEDDWNNLPNEEEPKETSGEHGGKKRKADDSDSSGLERDR